VELGAIALADEPFAVDSFGSDFDTQLGVFDGIGALLDDNDDADGTTFQSRVDFPTGLPVGEYFIALSGFESGFADGFLAIPFQGSEGGNFVLNHPGGPTTGSLLTEDVQWFRFSVAVPEPSTWLLSLVSIAALVGLARQARP
jgi:hypothetical protein